MKTLLLLCFFSIVSADWGITSGASPAISLSPTGFWLKPYNTITFWTGVAASGPTGLGASYNVLYSNIPIFFLSGYPGYRNKLLSEPWPIADLDTVELMEAYLHLGDHVTELWCDVVGIDNCNALSYTNVSAVGTWTLKLNVTINGNAMIPYNVTYYVPFIWTPVSSYEVMVSAYDNWILFNVDNSLHQMNTVCTETGPSPIDHTLVPCPHGLGYLFELWLRQQISGLQRWVCIPDYINNLCNGVIIDMPLFASPLSMQQAYSVKK